MNIQLVLSNDTDIHLQYVERERERRQLTISSWYEC